MGQQKVGKLHLESQLMSLEYDKLWKPTLHIAQISPIPDNAERCNVQILNWLFQIALYKSLSFN